MKRDTIKIAVFAASCLIAVTPSAQASDSVDVLQSFQNTCSQLLAVPPTAASLKCLSTYAKEVQDADLKAAVLATYAMGLICCDQAQDAYKLVQYLKQAYPMTPHLALFQASQYLADCPTCSGSGTAEGRCSQCGGRGTCKGCGGRGTTMEFNQAGATCKACQGSRQCPACQGSRRETVKCPLCLGKRQIASKDLMKSAYVKLIQQTQALALEHEREAKGLILFEGEWVTPADKQKELDKRDALAKAKQAEEEQKLADENQKKENEAQKLAEEKRKQTEATEAAEAAEAADPQSMKGTSPTSVAGRNAVVPLVYDFPFIFSDIFMYCGAKGLPEDEHLISLVQRPTGEVCINGAPISDSKSHEDLVWLQETAAEGYPSSMNNIGIMHALGSGAPYDEAKAVELFQRAARLGNGEAVSNLHNMYRKIKDVPRDEFKAFELLQEAARNGDPEAQTDLGKIYASGNIPKDPSKPGDGGFYTVAKTHGSPQELAQAEEWYQKAAMQGYARAQFDLGSLIYCHFQQRIVQAEAWQILASKGGHIGAPCALHHPGTYTIQAEANQLAAAISATITQSVKGRSQDEAELPERYQKLAMHGAFDAQYNLGVLYEFGIGVHADLVRTVAWYEVACTRPKNLAPRYVQAESVIYAGEIEKRLTPEQRADARALADSLLTQIYK